jgi:hypothetical protein
VSTCCRLDDLAANVRLIFTIINPFFFITSLLFSNGVRLCCVSKNSSMEKSTFWRHSDAVELHLLQILLLLH